MIKKIGANPYGVVEYAISTEEEVAQLPHLVGQGSTCIVIKTGNVYMFDEEDLSWHSLVDSSMVVKPESAKALEPKVVNEEVVVVALPQEIQPMIVEEKSVKKTKKSTKRVK